MSPPPGRQKEGSLPLGGTARSAAGEDLQQLAHALLRRDRLEQRLLLVHFGVDDAGCDVGEFGRPARGLQRVDQFARHAG